MQAAILICGGSSTRFGEADKVCADLAGRPLLRHVADRIEPVIDELVLNCRSEQASAIESALEGYERPVSFAFDQYPDAGPMHGMERGLSATGAGYALVVACDMPFVDPGFLEYLFAVAQGHEAALPRQGEDGWYQPLQAVYAVEPMLEAIKAAREDGVERPVAPALELDTVVVETEEVADVTDRTFFNVNTREDLDQAAAWIVTD